MTPRERGPIRFATFEFDPRSEELRRAGRRVRLQSQPAKLLALLLERAGELVTREEIRPALWAEDTHVDFDLGINAAVRQVRAALGDSAESPRFVETVPKRGYRFVAPVERDAAPAATPSVRRRPRLALSMLGAGIAAGLVAAALLLPGGIGARAFGGRPVLAVLPFEDLGPAADAGYFGDGLTEELIARLGSRYGRRMAVIARTSAMAYKGTHKTVPEIGRELGADYLLEGSVRRSGDRLRITAQLVRARDALHLWAGSFDRPLGDAVELQTELGETLARALALKLVPGSEAGGPGGTPSAETYDRYLRARAALHLGTREGYFDAAPMLRDVVRRDPGFAPGWVALARAIRATVPPPESGRDARAALDRALALDDESPEAHLVMGDVLFYAYFDREGARREYERAIELNPGYADAHHAIASVWAVEGRHREALAAVRRALALDPLSPSVNEDVGWYAYFARRYSEAIEASRRTLEVDPKDYWARRCIVQAAMVGGDAATAFAQARANLVAAEDSPEAIARVDAAAARDGAAGGVREYWRVLLDRYESLRRERFVASTDLAMIRMALGEREAALLALERGFDERSGWLLPFVGIDPLFDPLRGEPRFQRLVRRVAAGLPPDTATEDLAAAL